YDSKKSGSLTISHLRFGPNPIRSPYAITRANFVACHQPIYLDTLDMLHLAMPGGVFLLNTVFGPDEIWDQLPRAVQEQIVNKKLRFFVIDANKVAKESGMGKRINTVMQVCFFAISGVLPREEAIAEIKRSIEKTYYKKGEEVVAMNLKAVDNTLSNLFEVHVPDTITSDIPMADPVPESAPEFVRNVVGPILAWKGDLLPVSAMPVDGTFPSGTTQYEKRNLAP